MTEPRKKTGYLNSDFRIFYLTGTEARDFQSHYHDFHKLLYFESGSVSYYVEGETYELQPDDIVLVPAGEVHRPVIHSSAPYHRLILYLSPAFFERYRQQGVALDRCFSACSGRGSHVLRFGSLRQSRIYPVLRELIREGRAGGGSKATPVHAGSENTAGFIRTGGSIAEAEYKATPVHADAENTAGFIRTGGGLAETEYKAAPEAELYRTSVLLQLLLLLGGLSGGDLSFPSASGANPQVIRILSYINSHLSEALSVDAVADACYLNRSYLMHLFRRETGYTLGAYITEKRLFAARTLIRSGVPVTDAALASGFSGYASFYRAYRKKFGSTPKEGRSL